MRSVLPPSRATSERAIAIGATAYLEERLEAERETDELLDLVESSIHRINAPQEES